MDGFHRFDDIRIGYLREFLVFSQYMSVGKAARILNIAPSTLSKHLSELESVLKLSLISRGKRMALTPVGCRFADSVVTIVQELDNVYQACEEMQESEVRTLRVLASPSSAMSGSVYAAINRFIKSSPRKIQLKIVSADDEARPDALKENLADLVFWYRTQDIEQSMREADSMDVGLIHLKDEPMLVWGRKDHPLLQKGSPITFSELSRASIMTHTSHLSYDALESTHRYLFTQRGVTPSFDRRTADNVMEFLMLDPGQSVFILPASMQDDPAVKARDEMVFERVADDSFVNHAFLAYSLERDSEIIDELASFLKNEESSL